MRNTLRALAWSLVLTIALLGVIGGFAVIGQLTDVALSQTRAIAATSAMTSVVLLWGTVAILIYEILAARDDRRARGIAVPVFLAGLFLVCVLAYLVLLYRGAYYALVAIHQAELARMLVNPLVTAAINLVVLLFALAAFILVARDKYHGAVCWLRARQRHQERCD